MNETCRNCEINLTKENWYPALQRTNCRICKTCNAKNKKKWAQKNKEKTRSYALKHYYKNHEHKIEYSKKYRETHREEMNLRIKDKHSSMREETLMAYGNICNCCKETNTRFLTIDHVNNDGYKHRAELKSRSTAHIHRLIKKEGYPLDKYQILCYNCNMGKALNNGVCPHKTHTPAEFKADRAKAKKAKKK